MSSKGDIEEILAEEGFYLFTGNGMSMWPLIREGRDVVEVRKVTGTLKRGDVILFREGGRYVLHRIMEVGDGQYVTRGDNCAATETVAEEHIVGIMTGLWRDEKKLRPDSPLARLYSFVVMDCPTGRRIMRAVLKRI